MLLRAVVGSGAASRSVPPAGYGPADLRSAYNLKAAAATDGIGVTVAVVAPFDDPKAAADLAAYRARFGLPPCTVPSGCFGVVNQNGAASPLPLPSPSWAKDDSVVLDMVSAICPNCHIVLVEATGNAGSLGLLTAEDSAASVVHANVIVDGWQLGLPDINYDLTVGHYFDHPGVAITAPAGDSGLFEQLYPASSQFVTAVGGTTLTRHEGSTRGWQESAWFYTATGCSGGPKPSWQTDSGCASRMVADVSAVADPTTGVAFYDSYYSSGWGKAGGTVVAAAIVGGTYGLAGPGVAQTYSASYPYLHPNAFNDVTTGAVYGPACNDEPTYWCQAGPGYDGPTGWGTPDGIAGFQLGPVSHSIVTVIGVPYQASAVGLAITPLAMRAIDTTTASLTWSATGLPPGLSIDSGTGIISGTPTTVGTYPVAVTATDGSGSSTVHFTWNARDVITFGTGSDGGWYAYGTAVHVQVVGSDSASSEPLTYSASGLAPGLSIDPSTGVISGVMTRTGYWDASVTVSDPTGASATAGFFFGDYGVVAVSPLGDVTSVAGQPVTFGVHYTDTAPDRVYVNLENGPPGTWTFPFGPVRGWSMVPGVYHAIVDVADFWGLSDAKAQFTWTVLPAPDSGPNGPFRVGNGCLSLPGDNPVKGAVVRVARCAATATQRWTYVQDGTLRIGGLCLVAPGAGVAASGRLTIAPCTSADVVSWQIGQAGELYNPLAPGLSLCLTGRLGHWLALADCQAGQANQEWQTPAGPISSEAPGRCMGTSGRLTPGTRVVSVACTKKPLPGWTVSANGAIRSGRLCLAAVKGKAGSPLQLARCGPSSTQRWQIRSFFDGSSEILAQSSGLCLRLLDAGTASRASLGLARCLTTSGFPLPDEVWRIQ